MILPRTLLMLSKETNMAITIDYKPYLSEEVPELLSRLNEASSNVMKANRIGIAQFLQTSTLQHVFAIGLELSVPVPGFKARTKRYVVNAVIDGRPLIFESKSDAQSIIDRLRYLRKERQLAIKKMKKKVGVK